MGNFLEKNINWEKEAIKLHRLFDKINRYVVDNNLKNDKRIISIEKTIRHFRKIFLED